MNASSNVRAFKNLYNYVVVLKLFLFNGFLFN